MPYTLKHEIDKSEAFRLVVPYDDAGEAIPENLTKKSPPVAGEIVFFLHPRWKGRHTRRINDAMYATGGDGKADPRFGSGAREKILCGVLSIEGLVDASGKAITEMDREVHGSLPTSIIERILLTLNKLNDDPEESKEGE